jgi:hypothetical protein
MSPGMSAVIRRPTVRRRLDWKLRTAVSVAGPKLPSMAPGLKPLDASRRCMLVTHWPTG